MVMILYKYYKEVNTKMKYKKPKILIYSTLLYQIHTNDVPPKMTSKKLSEILQQPELSIAIPNIGKRY